jgi:[protein-PII] uridylyltransferase
VRIERATLQRLADDTPPLPEPWPPEARQALIELLLAGRPTIDVLESIDQVGLWVQVLPEWAPNRNRPQRNAYHRFTVDRHLFEAVVEASALADRVSRPDLLALGTLFHDIGKGYPGDHAEVGVDLVATIGPRMGYPPEDVATLQIMVREHLLLPDIATRRDLSDEATIRHVAERTGSPEVLRLLGALTEADSLATGTAAWGTWKAELVAELVERTAVYLGEAPQRPAMAEFPDEAQWHLLHAAETSIEGVDDRLTVVVRDRPGLFSRVAGALTLNGLDVLDAAAYTHDNGMALESFRVESSAGPAIRWDRVTDDVARALDGQLALHARVGERARLYARPTRGQLPAKEPEVRFDIDISPSATVIEVQAADSIGLLYRTTRALAELDLDIRSAKVQTLGQELVDSFYVVDALGRKVDDPGRLVEIERAIVDALAE